MALRQFSRGPLTRLVANYSQIPSNRTSGADLGVHKSIEHCIWLQFAIALVLSSQAEEMFQLVVPSLSLQQLEFIIVVTRRPVFISLYRSYIAFKGR